MKTNEGKADRFIRIAVGLVLAGVAWATQVWWLWIVAAAALLTGITGFCGLYTLLGITTCPVKK